MAEQSLRGERPSSERIATVEAELRSLVSLLQVREDNHAQRHTDNLRKLDAILVQTLATNGRVSLLEIWRARAEGAGLVGKWLIGLAMGCVGTLLGALGTKLIFH